MKIFLLRTLFVFTAVLFFLPVLANACSCAGGDPPCQSAGYMSAIFSGKVESISDVTERDDNNRFRYLRKVVKFSVSESFKGISEKTVEIVTGRGGGDCGYAFEVGREYVVYAYQDEEIGKLGTGICNRTRPIEKAEEDLQYFREIAKGPKDITISGGVFRAFTRKNDEPYRNTEPMPNITLTLSNGEKVVTNEKGQYRFDKLLPQEYTITPSVPADLWGGEILERKVKLSPNGCAIVSFALFANTALSGRVLDEDSNPAAKIPVQLVPVDQINIHQVDLQMAYTDQDGRFVFHAIPSGDYYLGVRLYRISELLFPYPRTFYPDTLDLNQAKIISIKEGDVLKDFEIKLGPELKPRAVSGVVVYADGTPAPNALISTQETEYGTQPSMGHGFWANPDGTFKLTLLDGLRHRISAYVSDQNTHQQRHSKPIEIPANGDVTDLKLILEPK